MKYKKKAKDSLYYRLYIFKEINANKHTSNII